MLLFLFMHYCICPHLLHFVDKLEQTRSMASTPGRLISDLHCPALSAGFCVWAGGQSGLDMGLLSPRRWATTATLLRAAGRPGRGNVSECRLQLPGSAGRAPACRPQPGTLMTYRLDRCGVHVSGQCHGSTTKTSSGSGGRASGRSSPVRDRGLDPAFCHTTLPQRPQMKDMNRTGGGGGVGLKRFSSCKTEKTLSFDLEMPSVRLHTML